MKLNSPLPLWEDLPADFWQKCAKKMHYYVLIEEDYWFGARLPINCFIGENMPNDAEPVSAFRILKSDDGLYSAVLIVPIFRKNVSKGFGRADKYGQPMPPSPRWDFGDSWHPYLLGYFSELKDAYIACQIHSQQPDIYSMFDMSINDMRCEYLRKPKFTLQPTINQ